MPSFVSTEKLILFSEIIALKTTRIYQRERFRSIIRLGVAHCYLLGISQTLCRGVHLSARPSSRSLLSVAPLAPFHFSREQFLSPRLSSFYRRSSPSSLLFLGTLTLFRTLESAFCHKYPLSAIESKEPRRISQRYTRYAS